MEKTGAQQPVKYYDDLYTKSVVYNCQDLQKSPYYEIWKKVIQKISKNHKIADFGCGNGLFAKHCLANNRQYMAGYDFSPVAISKAKATNPTISDCFHIADINNPEIYKTDYDVAVFCEVLEHLENDLEVLKNIPEYMQTIITVPNYDSASHVRTFDNLDHAIEHYRSLFFIQTEKCEAMKISSQNRNEIYILNCQKKWDLM